MSYIHIPFSCLSFIHNFSLQLGDSTCVSQNIQSCKPIALANGTFNNTPDSNRYLQKNN